MNSCWLDGRTAIVTGASSGMGAGIAKSLIKKHGCKVIGVARSEPKMLQFVEELGDEYKDYFSYKLFDVSVKENWENFAKEIKEEGVKPDILVNNAGILPKFKRFDKYSYEEIERAMNINFYSCVYSTKNLLPMLLESDNAAIINIASSAALMSLPGTSIYSASKSALRGFTESLCDEFSDRMFIGLVCPGFTKTDIFREQIKDGNTKSAKMINMAATDCDKMVNMIMRGIENKYPMQIRGFDAHSMDIFNRLMPVYGSKFFGAIMRAANVDIFKEVFYD